MIDDAIKKAAAEGAREGLESVLRSPAIRALIREIVREAVAEVVPNLLRPDEVARRYGYPLSTQRRHIREGRLRVTKIGRLTLIDVSQLRPLYPEKGGGGG